MTMDIVTKAIEFAKKAHASQLRKYTNEPYFTHLEEVASLVPKYAMPPEVAAAAYLHDVLEDTDTALATLRVEFGDKIASWVFGLTDPEVKGNRATRKWACRQWLSLQGYEVHTIKLADLISNTRSIVAHDLEFAKVYVPEKRALLSVLTQGDGHLYYKALAEVEKAEAVLASIS